MLYLTDSSGSSGFGSILWEKWLFASFYSYYTYSCVLQRAFFHQMHYWTFAQILYELFLPEKRSIYLSVECGSMDNSESLWRGIEEFFFQHTCLQDIGLVLHVYFLYSTFLEVVLGHQVGVLEFYLTPYSDIISPKNKTERCPSVTNSALLRKF